jgi:hypothetical protein
VSTWSTAGGAFMPQPEDRESPFLSEESPIEPVLHRLEEQSPFVSLSELRSDAEQAATTRWTGTPEQVAFRDRVLQAHLDRHKHERAVPDLPKNALARIAGTKVLMRKDAALAASLPPVRPSQRHTVPGIPACPRLSWYLL